MVSDDPDCSPAVGVTPRLKTCKSGYGAMTETRLAVALLVSGTGKPLPSGTNTGVPDVVCGSTDQSVYGRLPGRVGQPLARRGEGERPGPCRGGSAGVDLGQLDVEVAAEP